jgi:hypothetical protein
MQLGLHVNIIFVCTFAMIEKFMATTKVVEIGMEKT